MKKKYSAMITLLLIFLMFSGCSGTGISFSAVVPGNPSVQATVASVHPPPPYEEQGPPPWAPAHGYRAKHVYRYYPASEVYFDTGRGLYFYCTDGSWRASVSIPAGIRVDLSSGFVSLEMDSDRPYMHHTEVVKRYPHGEKKKYKKQKKNKNKHKHKDSARYGYR